eukprot:651086-Alexandrium_andersonii.AAC.1
MDIAAFDFSKQPIRSLEEDARDMLRHAPVRQQDGTARQLPREYIPMGTWPVYAPEQVIMLRRSNCRAFFPQLAKWRSELPYQPIIACQRVGISVAIALRHFG